MFSFFVGDGVATVFFGPAKTSSICSMVRRSASSTNCDVFALNGERSFAIEDVADPFAPVVKQLLVVGHHLLLDDDDDDDDDDVDDDDDFDGSSLKDFKGRFEAKSRVVFDCSWLAHPVERLVDFRPALRVRRSCFVVVDGDADADAKRLVRRVIVRLVVQTVDKKTNSNRFRLRNPKLEFTENRHSGENGAITEIAKAMSNCSLNDVANEAESELTSDVANGARSELTNGVHDESTNGVDNDELNEAPVSIANGGTYGTDDDVNIGENGVNWGENDADRDARNVDDYGARDVDCDARDADRDARDVDDCGARDVDCGSRCEIVSLNSSIDAGVFVDCDTDAAFAWKLSLRPGNSQFDSASKLALKFGASVDAVDSVQRQQQQQQQQLGDSHQMAAFGRLLSVPLLHLFSIPS